MSSHAVAAAARESTGLRTQPELLAPAGDWEAMRAAVANGADAVYFGLRSGEDGPSTFNARHRAANFAVGELGEVMAYLHAHNVKGYVTLNVLIFSDELPEAMAMVAASARAGVDAVIVQDLGLARLIGRLCPTLHVHGSTQMTLTEPLGIDLVRGLGVRRVILARELAASDIRKITAATDVPVEVFVHGALCVAYSGQCLTSESLGGRSANRGQCAQACRLPYDLIVDGARRDPGDKAYLLSPQDLAAYDVIDDLARLGVCSFKIEGRLKSAHYVAATTQAYRAAIDAASAGRAFHLSHQQSSDLAQSFSRGFTHGFLDGVNHQELVHARFPKSRGLRAGEVVGHTRDGVLVEPANARIDLKPGDGVVFDQGHPEQDEQGGRLFEVRPRSTAPRAPRTLELIFRRGDVSLLSVEIGATVWKTDDPAVRKRLEQSFSHDVVARRVPLAVSVVAREGRPLTITVADDAGRTATVSWDRPLERATKFPITPEVFREQFGRTGDTPFELGTITVNGMAGGTFPPVMIPKSVLNDLRRSAVQDILAQRNAAKEQTVIDRDVVADARAEIASTFSLVGSSAQDPPRLYVLVRTTEQLAAVLRWAPPATGLAPAMVYCEFEDVRKHVDAVAAAREAGVPIGLATVRVVKPGEEGLLRQVGQCGPDAILARNLAGLAFFKTHFPAVPLVADYSLNIANEATASIIAEQGVARMVPSYDLNWKQLGGMLSRFPPRSFEAVVHQHMPMFHMEHCVFCHTLSTGKDYRDCGRPCDAHAVDLGDRAGAKHPLVADVGCRNTVYNGTAQSAAEYIPQMRALGLQHFRVELLREKPADVAPLLDRYAKVLAGIDDGKTTWRQLRVLNQLGVTRGTLGE